ncbi:DTW domain-containing protein [Shewanella sp. AS1]|uniref:DTW domain-containing protein n=1 Tax=Shewanella sp. AS1 TaxID=2907626 RepID=UPI001F35A52A|nr:tRNA-uridine aminocarboxypropyltransferase [Shewanella sp. AS1]MCE9678802.1 DTW domain-containing protein [Shewanella sp. AS1]
MKIVLLTHERELSRPSNTGRLVNECLPELCRQVIWRRVEPCSELIQLQQACLDGEALLLFPQNSDEQAAQPEPNTEPKPAHCSSATADILLIILDATWQEARKMMRQSPYLQQAQRLSLSGEFHSSYQKRRNQIEGGLCTLECVEQVLLDAGMDQQASLLAKVFSQFNQV